MTRAPPALANCVLQYFVTSCADAEVLGETEDTHLQREYADTPSPLRQNCVPWHEPLPLHTVESVPCCQCCTRQRAALLEIQGLRHLHQTRLVECTVLTERAVDGTAETGAYICRSDVSCEMGLIKECEDAIAFLEASDARTGGDDGAGAIGSWDSRKGNGEGIFSL